MPCSRLIHICVLTFGFSNDISGFATYISTNNCAVLSINADKVYLEMSHGL